MTEKLPRTTSVEKPKSIDIGTPDQLAALYAGLDAAARNAETWTAGLRAYKKAMRAGLGIDQARWDALDAAAPDSDYWKHGFDTIEANLVDVQATTDEVVTAQTYETQESLETFAFSVTSAARSESAAYRHEDGSKNQDTVTSDDSQMLYGVYDGAGGAGGNPAAASYAASRSIRESLSDISPDSASEFLELLQQAHVTAEGYVERYGEKGTTVATTVKIIEIDGILCAGIAHAGDTRLFLYDRNNVITPLTPDQSHGNQLTNCLSGSYSPDKDQFSVRELKHGDRLMMCSDGITGDWDYQQLSYGEFQDAFLRRTPAECAARFVELSKKADDKSIVVVDIDALRPKN